MTEETNMLKKKKGNPTNVNVLCENEKVEKMRMNRFLRNIVLLFFS